MAKGRRRDEGPEPQTVRDRAEGTDGRPGVEGPAAAALDHAEVVIGAKEGADPGAFAGTGQRLPVLPGDVLLTLDHQAEIQRAPFTGVRLLAVKHLDR